MPHSERKKKSEKYVFVGPAGYGLNRIGSRRDEMTYPQLSQISQFH